MTRSKEAWITFFATRIVGVFVDAGIVGAAYLAAFMLRFDFAEPRWGWRAVAASYVVVCVVHLLALLATGCYSLAWRRIRVSEVPRYVAATASACVVLTLARLFLWSDLYLSVRPPYSITLICFVLTTIGIVGVRYAWRLYMMSRASESALLEREEKTFDNSVAARFVAGRTVLVTGAGGSIGSEIVRQVAAAGAKTVLMVERGENALYEIDREMRSSKLGAECVSLLADCADAKRMDGIFSKWRPSLVLHAAAYKHVPMVELNPEEGWRNNEGATRILAETASAYGVERFVLISTDKAVNPVSAMGKTKLAAERAILGMGSSATSFCAVRFGNVLGSSGSVVPLFKEQIAHRGPVTVTHPDMKRYFMTTAEAVGLVLQAASRPERGVIYTLDMGEPVLITDLAEHMIRQAGFRPYVEVPIVYTGVRPGEKLFEELDISERSAYKTDMAKIYITRQEGEGA